MPELVLGRGERGRLSSLAKRDGSGSMFRVVISTEIVGTVDVETGRMAFKSCGAISF